MQRYTVYLYLETALHVSGGTTTHHQERKQLYLQHLVFVTPLLLLAAIAPGRSNGVTNTRFSRVVCAHDDGWCCNPKHVERFPDKINYVTLHLVGYKDKGKGKAIPLQAWTGPEGSRKLRFPDFKIIGT
jgi:hypothetical protein